MRNLYQRQLAEPNFAALLADLRKRGAALLAIYDDHDFLGNNRYGGDEAPALRDAARAEMARALRPQYGGGDVYVQQRLGPVDVLLLDARFYRSAPLRSAGDRDAVLGVAQWSWLERAVAQSQAPYLLVASSTTLHSYGVADESWQQYPAAYQRLVSLLSLRRGALLVSGDVHQNAVRDDAGVIEVVSSAVARNTTFTGRPRRNYGVLDFGTDSVHVQLRSLNVGWRFDFSIPLSRWELP